MFLKDILNRWGKPAVASLTVLLAVMLLLTMAARQFRDLQGAVTHTEEVKFEINDIYAVLRETESNARGYLLSGHQPLRDAYKADADALPAKVDRLAQLTADNPVQRENIAKLRPAVEHRLALIAPAVERFSAGDKTGTLSPAEGSEAMIPAREAVDAMLAEENRLLALRRAAVFRQAGFLNLSAYLILFLVMTVAIFTVSEAVRRGIALKKQIAERQRAETAQSTTQQTLDSFINGVTDYAIYKLDTEGHVITWNSGAERIKGYRADEIIGQHLSRFYTPDDQKAGAPARALQTALTTGKFETETWRLRKDGSRFFASVLIDPLYDENGKHIGFAKITRDITERRKQEEALEQTRASLVQAQKMESIGHLTGGIAHDFNNMLAVILGSLNIIQRRFDRGDYNVRPLIIAAIESTQRGAALTQRLLAFARKQVLDPTIVDPNKLVNGMSDMIRRALGETLQTEVVLGGGIWRIHADAHQLETALLNLVINGRDAMPNGGKLTIETANAHLDEDYARRHEGLAPGQYVMISVSDTGTGIAADVLEKVFDPFFTTKKTGTELGLSQVYGFVKQSGGHLAIYSELGKGTTLRVYLPRHYDQSAPLAVTPPVVEATPRSANGETILVVEDEQAVRRLSVEGLNELGYTVLEADGAENALKILDAHPEIKLLFTDVVMPNVNGRELADEALKRRPDLKVLFTTGYTRNAIVHTGTLDPGVKLLSKPFMIESLARMVREVLNS